MILYCECDFVKTFDYESDDILPDDKKQLCVSSHEIFLAFRHLIINYFYNIENRFVIVTPMTMLHCFDRVVLYTYIGGGILLIIIIVNNVNFLY